MQYRRVAPFVWIRVALWMVLALLPAVAQAAGQPALAAYQARLAVLRGQIPAVTASAQQASDLILAHADAALSIPYWSQMSFAEELINRAGGLALAQSLGDDDDDRYRVLLLSVRSWEKQAGAIRTQVRAYRAKGWTVTLIGSAAGKPRDVQPDFFIDNGAPSGRAAHGRINVLANVTLGWMWCSEYAAAMSRKGKFPPILQSVHVPGAQEYDARIQSSQGRRSLVDCPQAIPAGELAGRYLARLDTLVRELSSEAIQQQLGAAAEIATARMAAGKRVGIAGMGHVIIEEVLTEMAAPWAGIRGVGNPDLTFTAHLQPGDVLVWMSYCGMNSPYDDYAKFIAQAKVELITCFTPDPVWSKDRPATLAHIDQSWTLPDAEVPIPLFPNAMAPVSGLNVTLLARMLDDEVAARLKQRRVRTKPAPALPLPPAFCDRSEWQYRYEGDLAPERAWGFVNAAGRLVAPMRYDRVGEMSDGRVAVQSRGQWGYLDAAGKVVIPPQYTQAGAFRDGTARVGRDGKLGYIDAAGTVVIPLAYDRIEEPMGFYRGWMSRWMRGATLPPRTLAFARQDGRWGLLDTRGTVVVPPAYEAINTFSDTLVTIRQGKKTGLMTLTGQVVVAPAYDEIGRFRNGFATFRLDGKSGILDATGKVVAPAQYTNLGPFTTNLVTLRVNGKWGGVTFDGKEVFPPTYDEVQRFMDGVARVRVGTQWGAIDASGNVVIPIKYVNIEFTNDGMTPVCLDGKWGYVNQAGVEVIPPAYDRSVDFEEGVAFVSVDGAYRLIDKTGARIPLPNYDYLAYAGEGRLKVARGGKWGIIDITGREIVPPTYAYIVGFAQGRAQVALGGRWREDIGKGPLLDGAKWGLIDTAGREIVPPRYDRVEAAGDGLIAVGKNLRVVRPSP